jgi:hypothetical protein
MHPAIWSGGAVAVGIPLFKIAEKIVERLPIFIPRDGKSHVTKDEVKELIGYHQGECSRVIVQRLDDGDTAFARLEKRIEDNHTQVINLLVGRKA